MTSTQSLLDQIAEATKTYQRAAIRVAEQCDTGTNAKHHWDYLETFRKAKAELRRLESLKIRNESPLKTG